MTDKLSARATKWQLAVFFIELSKQLFWYILILLYPMKKNYLSLISILTLVFSLKSCVPTSSSTSSSGEALQLLKKFYYPFDALDDGMVYEYVDEKSGALVGYWFYKTVKDSMGDRYLLGVRYNVFFEQEQFSKEWIVANGTILKDYHFIQKDSVSDKALIRPAEIEENVIFPFEAVTDSSLAYRFRLKFSLLPDSSTLYNLVRDRKFSRYIDYEFEGKSYKAVEFKSKEYLNVHNPVEGGNWDIESEMIEIFAEGIGLVYTAKKSDAVNYTHRLKRRLNTQEFEALAQEEQK